jgi:hypothetical protein
MSPAENTMSTGERDSGVAAADAVAGGAHTPGPWSIPTPRMGFSAIHGPDGQLVFGIAAGSADERRPEAVCEANANLIAAAPEMYEALKEAIENLEQTLRWRGEGWECSEDDLLGNARAALAKAEGRSC